MGPANRYTKHFSSINEKKLLTKIKTKKKGKPTSFIHGPIICGDSLDICQTSILTGSWKNNDQLQIWDLRNPSTPTNIKWINEKQDKNTKIYSCKFSKTNENLIIAGSTGNCEIRIFDKKQNFSCIDAIEGFPKAVYSVCWGGDGNKIAFGSGNGMCGMFEV